MADAAIAVREGGAITDARVTCRRLAGARGAIRSDYGLAQFWLTRRGSSSKMDRLGHGNGIR